MHAHMHARMHARTRVFSRVLVSIIPCHAFSEPLRAQCATDIITSGEQPPSARSLPWVICMSLPHSSIGGDLGVFSLFSVLKRPPTLHIAISWKEKWVERITSVWFIPQIEAVTQVWNLIRRCLSRKRELCKEYQFNVADAFFLSCFPPFHKAKHRVSKGLRTQPLCESGEPPRPPVKMD